MKGEITMKLRDFLSTLKTANVSVIVKDLQDSQVCKVDASSYSALDETVIERTINRWYLNGATSISVVLNDDVSA